MNNYTAAATYSGISQGRRAHLLEGLRDGVPVAMGYAAVAFSLGIAAKQAGLTPFQGFFASLFTAASAGEYSVFSLIAVGTTCLEIILVSLIVNARYSLMSLALNQLLPEDLPFGHRFLLGFSITDELFGLTIARSGKFSPYYCYGSFAIAASSWAAGTAAGIMVGEILPAWLIPALGVSLFGMFISAVIPAAKKDKNIAFAIVLSAAAGLIMNMLPYFASLSEGMRIIILTIIISSAAALLHPVDADAKDTAENKDTVSKEVCRHA